LKILHFEDITHITLHKHNYYKTYMGIAVDKSRAHSLWANLIGSDKII
jgi:hypothetical protein